MHLIMQDDNNCGQLSLLRTMTIFAINSDPLVIHESFGV
jgi:hypothetical protein